MYILVTNAAITCGRSVLRTRNQKCWCGGCYMVPAFDTGFIRLISPVDLISSFENTAKPYLFMGASGTVMLPVGKPPYRRLERNLGKKSFDTM